MNNICLYIKIKVPRLGRNQVSHLYSTNGKLGQRLKVLPQVTLEASVRAITGVTCASGCAVATGSSLF